MSENPLEFREHQEHAEHAAHAENPLVSRVTITIAILAVITAIIGSVESLETAGAVMESNKATLNQGLASDQWSFYQAKGIKKRLDEQSAAMGGPKADAAAHKAKQEGDDQKEIQTKAKEFEKQRDEARELAEKHEARHPKLTLAAALMQIAIAVSTTAIITGRAWPWRLALLSAAVGVGFAAWAFI
jgi:HPt (histidine-containing phosphotransfer) domain-containing protein